MKEKVAVATVQGKPYYLIVNKLRKEDIPFISLVPGESVPAKIQLVITTEQEKSLVNHEKILILHGEEELDLLVDEVKVLLLGKIAFQKIVFGLDPGVATGLVAVADGKVIEEANCFSTKEVIDSILKVLRNVRFEVTNVIIKIGNGVPVYKDLLKSLDDALPSQIVLEVVNEAGTNKPLKENKRSRRVRHISSATRITGRPGNIVQRGNTNAAHSRIQ
jgi:transcriptional accessory protein Tex/SPT6